MNAGQLNTVLSFKTISASLTDGDALETESVSVDIRVKLRQIEGYKKMQYTELLTKEVYEATCFNNSILTKNAVCTSGVDTYIVHSIIKNLGKSGTNEVKLILYK